MSGSSEACRGINENANKNESEDEAGEFYDAYDSLEAKTKELQLDNEFIQTLSDQDDDQDFNSTITKNSNMNDQTKSDEKVNPIVNTFKKKNFYKTSQLCFYLSQLMMPKMGCTSEIV